MNKLFHLVSSVVITLSISGAATIAYGQTIEPDVKTPAATQFQPRIIRPPTKESRPSIKQPFTGTTPSQTVTTDEHGYGTIVTDEPTGHSLINMPRISAGSSHTCTIDKNRTLWCWGDNTYGQLGCQGIKSGPGWKLPCACTVGSDWYKISVGGAHTCGIKTDLSLWCWGKDEDGQLGLGYQGDNLKIPITQPFNVPGSKWIEVSAGKDYTCGIKVDGTLWCWGDNLYGQLGLGPGDQYGQLGLAPNHFTSPKRVFGHPSNAYISVAAGDKHTCAVRKDQTLWCWGDNSHGQLGLASNEGKNWPWQAGYSNEKWIYVTAGDAHTCAIMADGKLKCWGWNDKGQLGDGTHTDKNVPTPIQIIAAWTPNEWRSVDAGGHHTCAVKKNEDALWTWGLNKDGQLGKNDTSNEAAPYPLEDAWISCSAGTSHTCGIKADNRYFCWGNGHDGALGNGTTENFSRPILVTNQCEAIGPKASSGESSGSQENTNEDLTTTTPCDPTKPNPCH